MESLLLWIFSSLERLWWGHDDLQTKLCVLQSEAPSVAQQWRLFLIRNKWNRFLTWEDHVRTFFNISPHVQLEYAARVGNAKVCQSLLREVQNIPLIRKPLFCPISSLSIHYCVILENLFNNGYSRPTGYVMLSPIRSAVLFGHMEVMEVLLNVWSYAPQSNLKELLRAATIMGHFEIVKLLFPLVDDAKTLLLGDLKHVTNLQVLEWLVKEIQPTYSADIYFCKKNPYPCCLNQDHLGECVTGIERDQFISPFNITITPFGPVSSPMRNILTTILYEVRKIQLSWALFIEEKLVALRRKLSPNSANYMIQKLKLLIRLHPDSLEAKREYSTTLLYIACIAGTMEHLKRANEIFPLCEYSQHNLRSSSAKASSITDFLTEDLISSSSKASPITDFLTEDLISSSSKASPITDFLTEDLIGFLNTACVHSHAHIFIAIMNHAKMMDTTETNVEFLVALTTRQGIYTSILRMFWHTRERSDIFIGWFNGHHDHASKYQNVSWMRKFAEISLEIDREEGREDSYKIMSNGKLAPIGILVRLMNFYKKVEPDMYKRFGQQVSQPMDQEHDKNRIRWAKHFVRREEFLSRQIMTANDYECAICYEKLADLHESPCRLAIVTECKHYYCVSCVVAQSVCPLCTTPLSFPDDQVLIHAFPN